MTAVEIDGLIVDDETGEVLRVPPEHEGADQLELLQRNWHDANEQEQTWKAQKEIYRRALQRYIDDHGGERATSRFANSTWVAPTVTHKAPAENVLKARQAELLDDERAADLTISAAKELDWKEVERWLSGYTDGALAAQLRAILIEESPRSGYVRTTLVARPAPEAVSAL